MTPFRSSYPEGPDRDCQLYRGRTVNGRKALIDLFSTLSKSLNGKHVVFSSGFLEQRFTCRKCMWSSVSESLSRSVCFFFMRVISSSKRCSIPSACVTVVFSWALTCSFTSLYFLSMERISSVKIRSFSSRAACAECCVVKTSEGEYFSHRHIKYVPEILIPTTSLIYKVCLSKGNPV